MVESERHCAACSNNVVSEVQEGTGSHRKLEKPVVRTCSTAESPGMTAAKGAARGNTICGFLRRCALTCRLCPQGFLQQQGSLCMVLLEDEGVSLVCVRYQQVYCL